MCGLAVSVISYYNVNDSCSLICITMANAFNTLVNLRETNGFSSAWESSAFQPLQTLTLPQIFITFIYK